MDPSDANEIFFLNPSTIEKSSKNIQIKEQAYPAVFEAFEFEPSSLCQPNNYMICKACKKQIKYTHKIDPTSNLTRHINNNSNKLIHAALKEKYELKSQSPLKSSAKKRRLESAFSDISDHVLKVNNQQNICKKILYILKLFVTNFGKNGKKLYFSVSGFCHNLYIDSWH